jgi:hypothetical protein
MNSMLNLSRRRLLQLASTVLPAGALGLLHRESMAETGAAFISDSFPAQPHELVREVVTVAHFDLKRLRELVDAQPSLANASWDWGFGDWESALGAASHMGNRPIAEYLISKGARPTIFSAAMLGQLDVVKAFVAAQPGVQRTRGPHGIALLAHARVGGTGAAAVFDYLHSLGDADQTQPAALSDSEASSLVGTYVFGIGVSQQVEITADPKAYGSKMYSYPPALSWTRKGTIGRPLFHLGERVFYPGGAPHVRVRFTDEIGAMVMTVTDANLVVSAKKKLETK